MVSRARGFIKFAKQKERPHMAAASPVPVRVG
jgi:hypothetical protein